MVLYLYASLSFFLILFLAGVMKIKKSRIGAPQAE